MTFLSKNEQETVSEAQKCAKNLKNHDILCLFGDLGAGKTVFAREIIRFLLENSSEEVPSPTFTLIQTYKSKNFPIFHYDLYRIKDPEEIFELGWEESLNDGISIIEWPERLGPFLPQTRIDIHIQNVENKPNYRQIKIERYE